MDPALLPLCPMSHREERQGKQGEAEGSAMAPRSRHSCRGLGSSPSILSLEPACVSVTNGNFLWVCLCWVWPIPSPGLC